MSLKRQADSLVPDPYLSRPLKQRCRTAPIPFDPPGPDTSSNSSSKSTSGGTPQQQQPPSHAESGGRTVILRVHEGDDYPFRTQDFWVHIPLHASFVGIIGC
jgi:hypothetical protein